MLSFTSAINEEHLWSKLGNNSMMSCTTAVALIRLYNQFPYFYHAFKNIKMSIHIYIYIFKIISEGRVSIEQSCLAMIPFKLELQGHWMTVEELQMSDIVK